MIEKSKLKDFLKEKKRMLIFFTLIILIGMFVGMIIALKTYKEGGKYILEKMNLLSLQSVNFSLIFIESFISMYVPVILILVSGLSIYLVPVGLLTVVLIGSKIGYTISVIVLQLGLKGIGIVFCGMFIKNLFFIALVAFCWCISVKNIEHKVSRFRVKNTSTCRTLTYFASAMPVILMISIFDIICTPHLLRFIYTIILL